MISKLKDAAARYNDGLLSADEFLMLVVDAIGSRWKYLKDTRVDHATRDTALDVDALADALAKLENR